MKATGNSEGHEVDSYLQEKAFDYDDRSDSCKDAATHDKTTRSDADPVHLEEFLYELSDTNIVGNLLDKRYLEKQLRNHRVPDEQLIEKVTPKRKQDEPHSWSRCLDKMAVKIY